MNSIWIGYDPDQIYAYLVARFSTAERLDESTPVRGVALSDLTKQGLYTRGVYTRMNQKFDGKTDTPISTEFALSRFLVPTLAKEFATPEAGWALFMDCDVLARGNLNYLFDMADPKYAVMCVQHAQSVAGAYKMDGKVQTSYYRKNWSSVCLFNCNHPSNAVLTPELVNKAPGLYLHQFGWLKDHEIGGLPPVYNFLVGHDTEPRYEDVQVYHYTLGGPWLKEFVDCPYADLWREQARYVLGFDPEPC